jgi:hypothetical protein
VAAPAAKGVKISVSICWRESVPADGFDPLRARRQHLDQFPPLAAAHRQHPLARQGEGYEGRPGRHAVTLPAYGLDGQFQRWPGRSGRAILGSALGAAMSRGRLHGRNGVLARER